MQRGSYEAVTDVPVLINCKWDEQQGAATFLEQRPWGAFQPVRVFTDADLKAGSKRNPLKTMTDSERSVFTAICELSRGLEKKDQLAITQARNKLGAVARKQNVATIGGAKSDQIERFAIGLFERAFGDDEEKRLLSLRLSRSLDSVRLVLWWSGERLHPALYCPDPKSALYTYVLTRLNAKRGLGLCPFCGNLFPKERPDQSYCSIRHREAHRVARWRAAKAAKSKRMKKARKNGTRKAR